MPGSRLAVNLAGIATSDLRRGDVLAAPGRMQATTAMDVRLEVIPDAPRPLGQNTEVNVYCGAAEVLGRVALLDVDNVEPGDVAWAQLRLRQPLAVVSGDRFIVRSPSPSLTIGGGLVVEPRARRHRRHDPAVLGRLELLSRGDPLELVLAALHAGAEGPGGTVKGAGRWLGGYGGRDASGVERLTGLSADDVTTALAELLARDAMVRLGTYHLESSEWLRLQRDALRILLEYHRQYPLRSGMPKEEWRSRLELSPALAHEVVAALVASGDVVEGAPHSQSAAPAVARSTIGAALLRLATHEPRFTPDQQHTVDVLLARFRQQPFNPPTRNEADQMVGAEVLAALLEQGTLVKLNDAILLERSAYTEVIRRIVASLQGGATLTVADARDLLGTSRKYMLAIFEYLDERRITRRQGDDRLLGPNAPPADAAASECERATLSGG
jgi:selenocysteine-specific elongation factor